MSQQLLDRELNECLTVELGWTEVAKGLTKILIGYGIWVAGTVFGMILVLAPLIQAGFKLEHTRLGTGELWMFYGGLGVLSVIGIFSVGIIMGGKWKCMINAPERNTCRWLMFLCMAALAMSWAFSLLSSISGVKVAPEFSRGVIGLGRMRFSTAGMIFNITSVGLSTVYICCFVLFLRAVAKCMDSRWLVRLVDLFLSLFVPLNLATAFVTYSVLTRDQQMIRFFPFIGLGWVACFVFWFVMIALVRRSILKTLERVRDPMSYSSVTPGRAAKREYNYN
jgi:hypothetical protein